jgi:hypothetical protein
MLDGFDALDGYELIILPDTTVVDPRLKKKLKSFHKKGGQLLISYRGGFDAEGNWALDFLPLQFDGEVEKYPSFWRAKKTFAPEMAASDRVFYGQGMNIKKGKALKVLVDRVLPYFKRTAITYSSHFQTPPVANTDKNPAVVSGEGFVYFADPIFSEYRVSGNLAVREVWGKIMKNVIGEAPFGSGLPSAVNVYPMRRGNDLLITLLHYVPVRKAMEIDVIDERSTFAGEVLKISGKGIKSVIDFASGEPLKKLDEGVFELPHVKGRLLLEVRGYFKK